MPSLSEIQDEFVAVLKLAGPARVVVQGRRGEGAEPAKPFTMWQMRELPSAGRPRVVVDALTETITYSASPIEFVVSFDGADAMADAQALKALLYSMHRYADLYTVAGLSGVIGPTDLSGPQLARYQTRADVRVLLSAALSYTPATLPDLVEHSCVTLDVPENDHTETFCIDKHGDCDNGG